MTEITVREYTPNDLPQMLSIWNSVVSEGNAFPQEYELSDAEGAAFFRSQTFTGVAVESGSGRVKGLYILHPNNVGRCAHISNASFAVGTESRGNRIGEKLVKHCLAQAEKEGFRILQFNAVVSSNARARRLYERCGFTRLGTIPGGFRMKDGSYEDICPYYIQLKGASL